MRGAFLAIAALAASALAGCSGVGLGESGPSAPVVGAPIPPVAAAPVAPVQTGALAPPASAAAGAPPAVAAASPAPAQEAPAAPPTPTGAALGAVLGGPVGAELSDADRRAAWQAQIAALDSGKPRSWRGAQGVFGSVEPGAETGNGCRAYTQTIYVAGRPNRGQGTACKQPEGGWRMTS